MILIFIGFYRIYNDVYFIKICVFLYCNWFDICNYKILEIEMCWVFLLFKGMIYM